METLPMTTVPPWFQVALDTPCSDHFINVKDVDIGYTVWGESGLPGVLLIHGSNAHREWWRFVAPFLARRFRVAALDLSGNGDSGWRSIYTREVLAQEVQSVCEAADLGPRPIIVGHSFGGFVALQTAWQYGGEAAGLILLDFTVSPPQDHTEWGLRAMREGKTTRSTRIYEDRQTALERFRLIPEQPCRYPQVLDYLGRKSLRRKDGGWTWKFDPTFFDHLEMGPQQTEQFLALKCPSAVFLGEHSTDEGALNGPWMHSISSGRTPVHTLPGTYHHLMFDEPMAVHASIEITAHHWLNASARKPS